MPADSSFPQRLAAVRTAITHSATAAQRSDDAITLIAVSKTRPATAIRDAYQYGIRHIGENYLQEALQKQQPLADLAITWHFIGALQSNKTRAIAERFDWLHSLSDVRHAQRLNAHRSKTNKPPLNVCLQVNIDQEASKSGLRPEQLNDVATAIASLPHVCLRGLMAIPAATTNPQQQRSSYARVRQQFVTLQSQQPSIDTLSMGMSGDFDAAIHEGATMVRIGSALFGQRAE